MTALVYCKAHLGIHLDADGICSILDRHRAGDGDEHLDPAVEPRCLPLDTTDREAARAEARNNGWPLAYGDNTHTWDIYNRLVPRHNPSRPS